MLRKPYLVNDVMAQDTLLDRRRVYRTLMVRATTHKHCRKHCCSATGPTFTPWPTQASLGYGVQDSGIPVPHHIIVDRDNLPPGQTDPGG